MTTKANFIEFVLVGWVAFVCTMPQLSFCHDEYVDFTDMGSYDHGQQINKVLVEHSKQEQSKEGVTIEQEKLDITSISVENASRPMKFLQRVVKSLLRQINVQSHTFGPGEALTIDVQAEIKYNDYVILNKFVNTKLHEEADRHLTNVDDIMSNLLHVVEHTGSRFEYVESIFKLPIFHSLKFWLVVMTTSVISFLIVMLSLKAVNARNNAAMLFHGFLIIFILSCIWTFSHMYEDAKAANYAKLIQSQNPPKDCQFENLSLRESIYYFFRVQLSGYKDQCEQYYSTTMVDPFWSVNPLEAISRSFSVLIFAPFEYIGGKIGLFLGGIISGIPFWLQPLLIIVLFSLAFISIFGYRIAGPFFTIEPARREYLENRPISPPNALTNEVRQELVERPERKVMKSIRNATTDMDGFEEFLSGNTEDGNIGRRQEVWWRKWTTPVTNYLWMVWSFIILWLDVLLRQVPSSPPSAANEQDVPFQNEGNDIVIPRNVGRIDAADVDPAPNRPIQQISIEEVIFPRRRMTVNLERNSENKENDIACDGNKTEQRGSDPNPPGSSSSSSKLKRSQNTKNSESDAELRDCIDKDVNT